MGFRDEDDATRARAEALQRELDDALRELGRMQISEREATAEAETLRGRVAELEKAQALLSPPAKPALPKRPSAGVRPLVMLAVVLLAALGGVLFVQDQKRQEQADAAAARRAVEMAAIARISEQQREARAAEEQRRAAEVAEPEPEVAAETEESSPAPERPMRHVEIEWPAKVLRAEGKSLRRGARCTVQASLESDGAEHLNASVDVTCGDEVLYRWADSLGSGMQMRDCNVGETPGSAGVFLHTLTCSDLGARTGRPQLSLDTEGHSAVVWREAAPTFRVELAVSGDGRAPGPPLGVQNEGAAAAFAPVVRTARVTNVSGSAPVARGAACEVRVEPRPGNQNCRTVLRCGTAILYGNRSSNGFNACELADGAFVRVRDDHTTAEGGDPRLDFDLAAGRIVVGDDDPTWEATLQLGR